MPSETGSHARGQTAGSIHMTGLNGLTVADIERHARLGIPDVLLAAAHVRRVSDREARELLALNGKAGDFGGIEYPYLHPLTGYRVTSRVRRDHPPQKADGSPEGKYISGYGDHRYLYFPPGASVLISNVRVPAVMVESEKAALALTAAAERASRTLLIIATGGCWGWRGRIGKTTDASGARVDEKGPLADFDRIHWHDRPAIILFDGNAASNRSVAAARAALAKELMRRGSAVRCANLPSEPGTNGPDDLIALRGDAALWEVIDAAVAADFVRKKNGSIVAEHLDNIRLALSKLDVRVQFNAFTQQVLVDGAPLDDATLDGLWVSIDDTFRFRPYKDTLRTVMQVDARTNTFHPVQDYLDALVWDGTPRLDEWLITYGGAEASEYVRAVGALPLIAAVRRVRHPGEKFDELLVLESAQGRLKSTALRTLCADDAWFSDDLPLGVDSKQVIERTAGKWIIEAMEMHGHRGKEAEQMKAFLSRQHDTARVAYGRLPTTVPRQFVMIGTTNAHIGYLKDSTGGRRFWPVPVRGFDIEALRRDRDQLWAEAAAREAAGASIRLPPELWSAAAICQEQRRTPDPWEETLEPLLDQTEIVVDDGKEMEAIRVSAVWETLGVIANQRDNRDADRIVAILDRFGFRTRKKLRFPPGGKPQTY